MEFATSKDLFVPTFNSTKDDSIIKVQSFEISMKKSQNLLQIKTSGLKCLENVGEIKSQKLHYTFMTQIF